MTKNIFWLGVETPNYQLKFGILHIRPYPLKTLRWDKAYEKMKKGKIKSGEDIRKSLHTYPMKIPNTNNVDVDRGVIEVTHSPTGCMLIKRKVFDKLIKHYPNKQIIQNRYRFRQRT